jgi:hypothetical protein
VVSCHRPLGAQLTTRRQEQYRAPGDATDRAAFTRSAAATAVATSNTDPMPATLSAVSDG